MLSNPYILANGEFLNPRNIFNSSADYYVFSLIAASCGDDDGGSVRNLDSSSSSGSGSGSVQRQVQRLVQHLVPAQLQR